jgi:hypothetical protein
MIKFIKKIIERIFKEAIKSQIKEQLIDITRISAIAQLKQNILFSNEMGITDKKYFENDIIVSLTSYGRRIYEVALTIESLMEQTVKPNKIILWLSQDEFTPENIPQTLKNLQKRGLIIEFCKDIKSYKKLVPALEKYPNVIIITVDDDVLYQYDMVENLLRGYKENPEMIYFCRGHRIKFKKTGTIESYTRWDWFISDYQIDKLNFPTGVGGVLYPPNCLHSDVTNEELFMTLAPQADDVWFYAMARLKGTLSKKVFTHNSNGEDYIDLGGDGQKTALWNTNMTKNDEQIRAVFSKYRIIDDCNFN